MAFVVLPAIDVADGRLAVWTPAGPRPVDAYGGDPLAAARAYAAAGARWAHVVDMDHAFRQAPLRVELVESVAAAGLSVQASGGIADRGSIERALNAGARRVVLASRALADEASAVSLLAAGMGDVVVGLEVRDGRVVARGNDDVQLELATTLGWLVAAGARGFVVTALPRVGAMAGPDVALIRRITRAGKPVVAAGGIASIDHLRAVRDAGAVGAVVGRAALDGGLDLGAAVTWSEGA